MSIVSDCSTLFFLPFSGTKPLFVSKELFFFIGFYFIPVFYYVTGIFIFIFCFLGQIEGALFSEESI